MQKKGCIEFNNDEKKSTLKTKATAQKKAVSYGYLPLLKAFSPSASLTVLEESNPCPRRNVLLGKHPLAIDDRWFDEEHLFHLVEG